MPQFGGAGAGGEGKESILSYIPAILVSLRIEDGIKGACVSQFHFPTFCVDGRWIFLAKSRRSIFFLWTTKRQQKCAVSSVVTSDTTRTAFFVTDVLVSTDVKSAIAVGIKGIQSPVGKSNREVTHNTKKIRDLGRNFSPYHVLHLENNSKLCTKTSRQGRMPGFVFKHLHFHSCLPVPFRCAAQALNTSPPLSICSTKTICINWEAINGARRQVALLWKSPPTASEQVRKCGRDGDRFTLPAPLGASG